MESDPVYQIRLVEYVLDRFNMLQDIATKNETFGECLNRVDPRTLENLKKMPNLL